MKNRIKFISSLGVVLISLNVACLPSGSDSEKGASSLKSITLAKPSATSLASAYGEGCKDVVFVDLTNKLAEASGENTVPEEKPDCDYIINNIFTQYQIKITSGEESKTYTDEYSKIIDVKLDVEKNYKIEYAIGYVNPTNIELKFLALFAGELEITSEQLKAETTDTLKVSVKVKVTEDGKAWGFGAKASGDKKVELDTEFEKPEEPKTEEKDTE